MASPGSVLNARRRFLLGPALLDTEDGGGVFAPLRELHTRVRDQSPLRRMLYVDTKTWLPDDLLLKADKMTMANSIELRVPLLDHRLLEFATALPDAFKLQGRETKRVLRRALSDVIPREILQRPKAGFPVPYETWLRTELRSQIEAILLDPATISRGYLSEPGLRWLLRENAASGCFPKEVFSLAVLELWHREFVDGAQAPS